ncbi:MAG: hypothetical protein Q8N99_08720 [Nanoarchaeota archaeon]|nr:hypothetical protein [Nanoarchaeota archaeon]
MVFSRKGESGDFVVFSIFGILTIIAMLFLTFLFFVSVKYVNTNEDGLASLKAEILIYVFLAIIVIGFFLYKTLTKKREKAINKKKRK